MEIEQSSLYMEIQAIINSPAKPVHYQWVAQWHVNNQTYNSIKVLSVDIVRDYENSYSDEIHAEITMPYGTFYSQIFPFMDTLEITLYKYPLLEQGDTNNAAVAIESERYTAVIQSPTGSPRIENNNANTSSEQAMNLQTLLSVKVELINKSIEQLRMKSFGNTFRRTTVEKVIRAVMTQESQNIIIDKSRINKGVEMVPADNKQIRDHVVIPQGTPIVDIPSYVHERCGGVYGAGFGYYLQNDHWYVYPCYDPTRFNRSPQAVTIINIPKNKFPQVERTYRQDGTNIVVMATGEVKFSDMTNAAQLNHGNGVRFADANKMMGGFAVTSNNQTVVTRGGTNTEAINVPRANGLNNVKQSSDAITANPYQEYSKLARRSGAFLALTWENSNPMLITPGMLVLVMYLDGNTIGQIYGVVNQVHHTVRTSGPGLTNARHITDSGLSIFVKRPVGNGDVSDLGVIDPT